MIVKLIYEMKNTYIQLIKPMISSIIAWKKKKKIHAKIRKNCTMENQFIQYIDVSIEIESF